MKITLSTHSAEETHADALIIVTGSAWQRDVAAFDEALGGKLAEELERQGFNGEPGAAALLQTHGAARAPYVLAIALGDAATPNAWLALADAIVSRSGALRAKRVALRLPASQQSPEALERLAEGVFLTSYQFTDLKTTPVPMGPTEQIIVHVAKAGAALRTALKRGQALAEATSYARDLINLPAANATPRYLASRARAIGRSQKLTVKVLDEAGLKRQGMGALLGVAQGSAEPPRFLELIYKPSRKAKRTIALVGKGVTFDSGGLSLKTAGSMESMKRDMAGGGVVLGVMSVIRDLAPTVEVRAYVPATENMPGGHAIKPGDVLQARNGKTIEVLNTDAEGRLILADALSYATAAKPDVIINLATLTGAVRMALGPRYAAIMGSDQRLIGGLIESAQASGEGLWQLPLVEEYRPDIDSQVADIKNTGAGYAGTIIGALFLREFVGQVPWAHIDFSSTVVTAAPRPGHPMGASGFGVRTVLRYLLSL